MQDVYQYGEDEGALVKEMVAAAGSLLRLLSPEQASEVSKKPVDDDDFWFRSNPELYVNPGQFPLHQCSVYAPTKRTVGGLRLDECNEDVQKAVHGLLRVSSTPEGYEKILGCTLTNDFLGRLVHSEAVLNAYSYNSASLVSHISQSRGVSRSLAITSRWPHSSEVAAWWDQGSWAPSRIELTRVPTRGCVCSATRRLRA
jgi:hypothetical protein